MDKELTNGLRELVERRSCFVHLTHVNPDADGIGSALAMHRWLRSRGLRSEFLVPAPLPRRISFLAREGEIRVADGPLPSLPADAVACIYDVATLSRLGSLEPLARRAQPPVVVFDHHDAVLDFAALALVDVSAGSTSQVVFDVLDAWGEAIPHDIAVPLYVAMVSDTGSFNYGKTSPHTHRVAARLLEAGVDPLEMHGLLEGRKTLEAIRTGGDVLRSLTIDAADPRLAHATMSAERYADGGADALEMLDLVNMTIALDGVRAGVLFIEATPDVTRLSLRSKGSTSIVEVARHFGGGGHSNAAGATVPRPLREVRDEVLALLRRRLVAQHGEA